MLQLVLSALVGYLLGSLSFSIILSRLRYRDDIRRHGSGICAEGRRDLSAGRAD